jgi:hypothetical protein
VCSSILAEVARFLLRAGAPTRARAAAEVCSSILAEVARFLLRAGAPTRARAAAEVCSSRVAKADVARWIGGIEGSGRERRVGLARVERGPAIAAGALASVGRGGAVRCVPCGAERRAGVEPSIGAVGPGSAVSPSIDVGRGVDRILPAACPRLPFPRARVVRQIIERQAGGVLQHRQSERGRNEPSAPRQSTLSCARTSGRARRQRVRARHERVRIREPAVRQRASRHASRDACDGSQALYGFTPLCRARRRRVEGATSLTASRRPERQACSACSYRRGACRKSRWSTRRTPSPTPWAGG